MGRRKQAKPSPHGSASASRFLPGFQGLGLMLRHEHALYLPKAGPSSSLRSWKLISRVKSKEAGGQEMGEVVGGGGGGNGIRQDPEDLSVPFGCVWGWGNSHSLPPAPCLPSA